MTSHNMRAGYANNQQPSFNIYLAKAKKKKPKLFREVEIWRYFGDLSLLDAQERRVLFKLMT